MPWPRAPVTQFAHIRDELVGGDGTDPLYTDDDIALAGKVRVGIDEGGCGFVDGFDLLGERSGRFGKPPGSLGVELDERQRTARLLKGTVTGSRCRIGDAFNAPTRPAILYNGLGGFRCQPSPTAVGERAGAP